MANNPDNCIQFKDSDDIPCKNIQYENFTEKEIIKEQQPRFNPQDFNKFLYDPDNQSGEYNNPNFTFDKDYINEQTSPKGQYTVRQQQKFVPKYANFHTNFQGLLIYHGLGSGKCLALNTPVLMYDGTIKKVQNIKPREIVMGDDSTPREVLSLGRGQQQMYDIVPTKGNTFGCNSEHILCLKTSNKGVYYKEDKRCKNQKKFWVAEWIDTTSITKKGQWFETKEEAELFFNTIKGRNNTINIEVKDFLKLPKSTQSQLKLYRTGVDFREQETPLDPYIIGLWLGNGNNRDTCITNQDSTIIKYLKETLSTHNCYLSFHNGYTYRICTTQKENIFTKTLNSLNLINNKHIPDVYKINSRNNRLQLLAGLIDTDGSLGKNGCFDIIQKNETLANDIEYLVRSLGFYTKIQKCKKSSQNGTEGTYYRMCISGNIHEIPTKIPRKQANIRTQKKNVLVTGFKVIPKGIGNYYGFTVDKNHKFLLGDFTVTHNTCTSILVGEAYKAFHNEKVLKKGAFPSRDNRIIVVLPPATMEQFKEELYGKYIDDKYTGCVSNIQYDEEDVKYIDKPVNQSSSIKGLIGRENRETRKKKSSVIKQNRETRKTLTTQEQRRKAELEVQKYWNITTYIKFINGLVHRKDEENLMNLTKQLQRGGQLVIIDEIQNLISESGILYKKLINIIKLFSHNNKFVVLSATPIYDKPFEIGLTLNLLNPRLYFPSNQIDFNNLFFKKKNTTNDNDERKFILSDPSLFYWMCSGYISYFSGGNPQNFPFKRIIEVHHKMKPQQEQIYFKILANEIKKDIKKEKEKTKSEEEANDQMNQNYLAKARAYCNITYPEDNNPDNKKMKNSKKITTMKTALEKEKTLKEKLTLLANNYSQKIANIVESIINSKGTVLVFSDLIYYGVDAIAAVLETLGYTSIGAQELEKVNTSSKTIKLKGDDKKRFSVWSGEAVKASKKQMYSTKVRSIFNDTNNAQGKNIKIILGTTSIMEGISFLNVRDVHIVNPWWNESRLQQVIARAVRFKSHDALDENDRFVNVYKHYSVLQSFPNQTTNAFDKENKPSDKKIQMIRERGLLLATIDQHIGRRAKVKKEDSREFELLMKASAVDCQLNSNANLTRLEENIIPRYNTEKLENKQEGWLLYYENPSNGKTYFKKVNNTIVNTITDEELKMYEKEITYNRDKEKEKSIEFIHCEKFFPELYTGKHSTRASFYSYKEDKENKDILTLENKETKLRVTKEYIINESIDCVKENYDGKTTKLSKEGKNILNRLIDESNNYRRTVIENETELGTATEVMTNVLYPKNVKFLDQREEEKLKKWLSSKIKKTSPEIKKSFNDWIGKEKDSSKEKEKKELLLKILTQRVDGCTKEMIKIIVEGKDLTPSSMIKIKTELEEEKTEDEIKNIIDEAKKMYVILENLDINILEAIAQQ